MFAAFVDRFYKGMSEAENTALMLKEWQEQTDGWVPEKINAKYVETMSTWATTYYQEFSKDDGVRNGSEKLVENDRFLGYLDGLSHDGLTIHEVKTCSRSKQLSEQLLKFQTSTQVKLYAVLTRATGVVIELAFKDSPVAIYRAERYSFTKEQVAIWEQELNALADAIYALGDDPHNYTCTPESCSILTKNFTSICAYQPLCLMGLTDETKIAYKPKAKR